MKTEKDDTRPKPNYEIDPNVQARSRAGRRSSNRNAGKDLEEGIKTPAAPEAPAEEEKGGITAEAEKELDAVKEEGTPEEEAGETPEEEATEPKAEEVTETPAEEVTEPKATKRHAPPVGEYQAPEGESHEELIDKYHEALAFGDLEQAKDLYKKLQEHRFSENRHQAKSSDHAEQEAQDYADAAEELAKAHPELNEDGVAANKVLALTDVYRQEGMTAAESLRKAVADLYPEAAAPEVPAMEEVPPAPVHMNEGGIVPNMAERMERKRTIPAMPNASARNEPPPAPEQPTRSSAIKKMRDARGQS